jgi:hypothetical protein
MVMGSVVPLEERAMREMVRVAPLGLREWVQERTTVVDWRVREPLSELVGRAWMVRVAEEEGRGAAKSEAERCCWMVMRVFCSGMSAKVG